MTLGELGERHQKLQAPILWAVMVEIAKNAATEAAKFFCDGGPEVDSFTVFGHVPHRLSVQDVSTEIRRIYGQHVPIRECAMSESLWTPYISIILTMTRQDLDAARSWLVMQYTMNHAESAAKPKEVKFREFL